MRRCKDFSLPAPNSTSTDWPAARTFAVNARGATPTPAVDTAASVVTVLPPDNRRAFAIPLSRDPALRPLAAFATATAIPTWATESRFAGLRVGWACGHSATTAGFAHAIPVAVDHAGRAGANPVDGPAALLVPRAEFRIQLAIRDLWRAVQPTWLRLPTLTIDARPTRARVAASATMLRLDAQVDAFQATTRLVCARTFTGPVNASAVDDLALVVVAAAFLANTRVFPADAVVVVVTSSLA